MALALKVPAFFVVTKVDICPAHVLHHSLATLSGILRKPGVKKKPFMVSTRLPSAHHGSGRQCGLNAVLLLQNTAELQQKREASMVGIIGGCAIRCAPWRMYTRARSTCTAMHWRPSS